jgi:SAM-dependent methyltransferase
MGVRGRQTAHPAGEVVQIRNKLLKTILKLPRAFLFRLYVYHHRLLHRLGVLPYDRHFGFARGTPVGRYYVEKFLRENAHYVKGHCLEFGDSRYKSFFPAAERYEVLDLTPGKGVDYACDIHDPVGVPEATFDSVICTQVFEHLAWPEKAAAVLFRLLKPGGVLLLTAPFLSQVHGVPSDFRRFTPDCLAMILKEAGFVVESVDFGGNSNVGLGSLLGMVQEDFSRAELERKDPVYPYNVLIRATLPLAHL